MTKDQNHFFAKALPRLQGTADGGADLSLPEPGGRNEAPWQHSSERKLQPQSGQGIPTVTQQFESNSWAEFRGFDSSERGSGGLPTAPEGLYFKHRPRWCGRCWPGPLLGAARCSVELRGWVLQLHGVGVRTCPATPAAPPCCSVYPSPLPRFLCAVGPGRALCFCLSSSLPSCSGLKWAPRLTQFLQGPLALGAQFPSHGDSSAGINSLSEQ